MSTFIELLPNSWFEYLTPKITPEQRIKKIDEFLKPTINVNYNKYTNSEVEKYLSLSNKEKLKFLQNIDLSNGNQYYYSLMNLPKNSTYIDTLINDKCRGFIASKKKLYEQLINSVDETPIISQSIENSSLFESNVKVYKIKSKREKVPSTVRNALWKDYFGQSIQGVCQCCKREDITMANFEAGHIISVKDGGENQLSNLKPVCSQCNKSMGSTNMDNFIKKHGFDVEPPIKKLDNIEDEIKKELLSMNNDKLKLVCKNINIKVTYNNKTECFDAIKSFFDKKNKDDLVELCKSKSINYSGNKIKLIMNLIKNSIEINI
jgi:5-methylcytosine-specific restriction endonuclease McrA